MMTAKIVVVGSINVDLVTRVSRFPEKGETLSGTSFATFPGGKGANQAVCTARLGAAVTMIGRVGEDMFAGYLREGLKSFGIATEGVQSVPGTSGCAVIAVTDTGENRIVVVPGANAALQPEILTEHLEDVRKASMVLTQLETPLATLYALSKIAEEENIPLMLDPAPAQQLSSELLKKITWLTPNEGETCALIRGLGIPWGNHVPESSLPWAADHLLNQGVQNVVLKLGERGIFMKGKHLQEVRLPAFPVKAADTTAAGDAFNGGFAFALTQGGMDPERAARFACAVAALSVTRAGAQPSMPTLDEVQAFLAAHGERY